jgi:hypothetical protein
MNSNEKLLKILDAIQETRKASVNPSLINLYLTKADGLDEFDANEIGDILNKVELDKVIKIEGVPGIVDLHTGTDIEEAFYNTRTYFSIRILKNFDKWLLKLFPDEKSIEPITYDSKIGKLSINNKVVFIRKNTFRSNLVALLFQNKKKVWNWDEIVEKIEGITDTDVLKQNKKRVYIACDGIQKRIAQKIEISDFLKFDTNTVHINPKYLNTPSNK